jgi:hypothetical protein
MGFGGSNANASAVGRELHRVRDEARHDLANLLAITDDDRVAVRFELDQNPALARLRRVRGHLDRDDLGE